MNAAAAQQSSIAHDALYCQLPKSRFWHICISISVDAALTAAHQATSVMLQALSGQPFDEEAQQSAYNSLESPGQTGMTPSTSLGDDGAANSPGSQPSSHMAAQGLTSVQQSVPAEGFAGDANVNAQQQTTASNDGLIAGASYDTQQDAAASVHATALDEELLASDGETNMSSAGWQTGRQQHAQGMQHMAAIMQQECKLTC